MSHLYAAVARARRERYARRPDLRRRLRRPVISVGNLAVGGRGKTPTVACLARLLLEAGERPAILTRGYGRTAPEDGVVVVSAPEGLRADLARAGDEPLMLARQLPGVPVLVSADRYLAGRLAEHHFGVTVHLLDDGFQHLQLDRDVDLVIVTSEDLDASARTLPSGRLREGADSLIAADAVLAASDDLRWPGEGDVPLFSLRRAIGDAVVAGPAPTAPLRETPVFALAGIADPQRFLDDLTAAGWTTAGALVFGDHHPYSRARRRARSGHRRRGSGRAPSSRPRRTSSACCRSGRFRCRSRTCRLQWSLSRRPSSAAGSPPRSVRPVT